MPLSDADFDNRFSALTGHPPFPWQLALFRLLESGDIPPSCNLPTGLGKTSVIAVWLIALANGANVPRRLVYVVNRRTVVDQTTDEVEKYRYRLHLCPALAEALLAINSPPPTIPFRPQPLAISTLRGQFADNREWSADPSRPAVICGTVDMIGSRLLFSGYGLGRYDRAHEVGLLGCDTLLIHDEAHLTDPFQKVLFAIQREQTAELKYNRGLKVMELTATLRQRDTEASTASDQVKVFGLTLKDEKHPVVLERLNAQKTLCLHEKVRTTTEIVKLAGEHKSLERAILVFVQTPDQVNEVVNGLIGREHEVPIGQIKTLTGTMRGYDRDKLATADGVFARFLPQPKVEPTPGTVYLVCTSAGEVGVDISADHLVCDLSTYESMAQRFGRVNRRGGMDPLTGELRHASIDIVHEPEIDTKTPRGERRQRTLLLLKKLVDEYGASASLNSLRLNLSEKEKTDAFLPPVSCLEATDILFDTWALTTISGDLPGRPPVAQWLHGLEPPDQPTTSVAWREEVSTLAPGADADTVTVSERAEQVAEYLKEYPLQSQEQLAEKTARLVSVANADPAETGRRQHLKELAKRAASLPAWLIERDGLKLTTIGALAESEFGDLMGRTVVLPPLAGGLSAAGMLDGREAHDSEREYDVADCRADGSPRTRYRQTQLASERDRAEGGFEQVVEIVLAESTDGTPTRRFLAFVRADELAGDRTRSQQGRFRQNLDDHLGWASHYATVYGERLLPDGLERKALIVAAKYHDLGKLRDRWQNGVGNPRPRVGGDWKPIAKSGRGGRIFGLDGYRHEFGSLIDIETESEFLALGDADRDLVMHLIAAHHGRARPHFPADEAFDPDGHTDAAARIARDTPRRFAQLQRKYGRWGLAYLESLLRAADWAASGNPSAYLTKEDAK